MVKLWAQQSIALRLIFPFSDSHYFVFLLSPTIQFWYKIRQVVMQKSSVSMWCTWGQRIVWDFQTSLREISQFQATVKRTAWPTIFPNCSLPQFQLPQCPIMHKSTQTWRKSSWQYFSMGMVKGRRQVLPSTCRLARCPHYCWLIVPVELADTVSGPSVSPDPETAPESVTTTAATQSQQFSSV